MATRLYTHANCIPIPHGSRSLTALPPASSFYCRTAYLHGFPHTSLRSYTTTLLHACHPAGIQQDKGVPEMAPRRIASCYYLFYPRYVATRLSGYIATRLHDYANTLGREKPFTFASRRFLFLLIIFLFLIVLVQILIGTIRLCGSIHTCPPSYIATGILSYTPTHRSCQRKRDTAKGAPFNGTGSPLPNSHRPPRYACQSIS